MIAAEETHRAPMGMSAYGFARLAFVEKDLEGVWLGVLDGWT
jgi:hypothetical protein